MRRIDREITDFNELINMIQQAKVCRLGLVDKNTPYIIPLNYGFEVENQQLIFYFHSAKQGRKIDILKENSNVCIEIDYHHHLIEGDIACDYGFSYESVICFGVASFIKEERDKKHALDLLMQHQTDKKNTFEYSSQQLSRVEVFKVIVFDLSGKRRPLPSHKG